VEDGKRGHGFDAKEEKGCEGSRRIIEENKKRFRGEGQKVDAAPGLPGRSPIPVLFRPKGA
jgi:hypothetical protein